MRRWRPVVAVLAVCAAMLATTTIASPGGTATTTLYVAQGGSDATNDCTSATAPCATISHAVAQAASGDSIEVAGTVDDNVILPQNFGSLVITQWPGETAAIVDGTASGSVFSIGSGDTVTLDGLTIENGKAADGAGIANSGTLTVEACAVVDNQGAGSQAYGTIYNVGTLTVTGTTVSGNTGLAAGGGIYNGTTASVTRSTISGNSAGLGGGIFTSGTLTVTGTTISGNTGLFAGGGGIVNSSGYDAGPQTNAALTVTDSTIADNTADGGPGGGIDNDGGTVTLAESTVSGNVGGTGGGGIENLSPGTITVTDSTIADNTATGGSFGGGISSGSPLVIIASTIAGNSANVGGGISQNGPATVAATIIAGNSAANSAANCSGPSTSAGYNLTDDPNGTACGFTASTDLAGVNPDLGPLAQNGGATLTMAPAPGSPAIARIPLDASADGTLLCPGIDQRGVARPQPPNGTACSIGAVEEPGVTPPVITSPSATTFTVGVSGSFQVTANGYPAPSFQEAGALPQGVSFSSTGLLSGTPASGTAGSYPITVLATNGVSPDAVQAFTLTVVASGAVVTEPATALTSSDATLNGAVNPGGAAQTCHYAYGTASDLAGASATPSFTTPASSSPVSEPFTVTGLTPGTTYFFALECTNGTGAILGFTTLSTTPYPIQLFGSDGIGTSIAVSKQEFPTPGSASCVVLARDDFFSDALAGGPLAAACGGPLLLTEGAPESATLDSRTQAEIVRVLPPGGTVYVLGGDLALSPDIDATLESLGYQVVREAGADEYATAVDIAEALGNPTTIFEATGLSFYDALSAVPAAIANHAAILLTDGATQAPETAAYLAAHPGDFRYSIGGPLAAGGADPSATNIAGADLYGTAAAVARFFFPNATIFGAATAFDFQDALAGGVFMATGGRLGPMLLVESPPFAPPIVSYLNSLAIVAPRAMSSVALQPSRLTSSPRCKLTSAEVSGRLAACACDLEFVDGPRAQPIVGSSGTCACSTREGKLKPSAPGLPPKSRRPFERRHTVRNSEWWSRGVARRGKR